MDKKTEQLMDSWLFHAFKSGDRKVPGATAASEDTQPKQQTPQKGKKNKRPRGPDGKKSAASPEVLEFLQAAGLVSQQKKQWVFENEFTGYLSAAKSGLAFVPIGTRPKMPEGTRRKENSGARGTNNDRLEAIIPHNDRAGALHRDRVKVRISGYGRGRFTAKVVEIVEPFSGEYLARVLTRAQGTGTKGNELRVAELIDLPDRPQVLVQGRLAANELIYLKRSDKQSQFLREHPHGGYNRTTAFIFERSDRKVTHDRKGDLERLRLRYMLPEDFDKALIPRKKDIDKLVKQELKNSARVKVKDRFIFTIDGEDAKDFDDAISVTPQDGGYELDVHIADVGFFVSPQSPLFAEALKRGNSYYLAGSVIPMLPEILSNEFCSLKPKTHRLAFSVRMFFDNQGIMRSYELFKSIIFIDKRFTYNEAHKSLAGKKSPLADALRLSEILIKKRDGDGRIDLNIAEQKAVYDKKGKFTGIASQERLNSHRLVEECMLSANQAVANYAIHHNIGILHRNHESMPVDKLERLNKYLEKYTNRLKIQAAEHREIGRVLQSQALDPVREVFQILLLRSFMQANYMPDGKGHWGLAFREYAHFTSPIRRFADLVTHISLASHLAHKKKPFLPAELDLYGRETSRLERIAFEAERADKKLLAIRAMDKKVGQIFVGWMSGFTSDRLFISLVDFPVEGEIDAIDVDKRGEIKVIDDFTVFAGSLQKSLSLGDKFKVRLVKADPLEMALKFTFS